MPSIWRSPYQHLWIILLYLAAACLITWPLLLDLSGQFLGGDTSDAYEMARHIWWFKYALQNGLDLFWQSNLGYPDGFSGVSLQANTLQFFPAWLFAFFMPLASAYNITILLTMALNGWAAWLLARSLIEDAGHVAPLLAGLIFMSFPTFQGHLFDGHAGLMVMWPVPMYVLALWRYIEQGGWRWLLLSVAFFWLSPSGHMLQVIYVLMPLTALILLGRMWLRDWVGVRRILLMGLISSFLLLGFLLPVIIETLQSSVYTDTGGYVRYSADLLAIVSPSFLHPFFGQILDYPRSVLGVNLAEGSSYVGILAAVLALIGLARRREARWWLGLALLAWLLSLGPLLKVFDQPLSIDLGDYQSFIALPWALVQGLPGFSLARTPGRFSFTIALAVAMLAAYGAAVLWRRSSPGRSALIFVLAGAFILWEYQSFWPMPTRPAELPEALYDLRERDDLQAVFNLPYEHLLGAKEALYMQTAHELPLIAGQVTRQTPVNPAKLDILQSTLDPALLQAAGADLIILHRQRAREIGQEGLEALAQAQLGDPIYSDDRIALYEVAPALVLPEFAASIADAAAITDRYEASLFAGPARWLDFEALVIAEQRDIDVLLDGQVIQRWQIDGPTQVRLPIPASDYMRLTLQLNPPCPAQIAPGLLCSSLEVQDARFTLSEQAGLGGPVGFDAGILLSAQQISLVQSEQLLRVRLFWRFAEARRDTDIRFIHIIDSAGELVAQQDQSLGTFDAGEIMIESIELNLEDLPPGEYSIRAGWYDFNSLTNIPTILDGTAASDWADLGSILLD